MSVNSTNDAHPPSNSSLQSHLFECIDTKAGLYLLSTVTSTYLLLVLPLCLFVLYLGIQQWRHQCSVSTAATMSHSDFFTCNMAVIELIAVFGYIIYYCRCYTDIPLFMGPFVGFSTWLGQMLFPVLTCAERYLAVVHPVTYMSLRHSGGVRIRNIATGCVWLMCFGGACFLVLFLMHNQNNLPTILMLIFALVVMTFLSLSVLRALIRPRPGAVGGDRVQVDRSKQRAFNTIILIMAVLWVKLGGNVIAIIITSFSTTLSLKCVGQASTFVFSLPGSLVLFLLFLHRAGKLPNCKHNTESE